MKPAASAQHASSSAAVHLYESLGFTHVTREELGPLPYVRADTFMRFVLQ